MTKLTHTELMQTIARVRRAMPRNADVMAICDAVEVPAAEAITAAQRALMDAQRVARRDFMEATMTEKPPFNKKAYQRELMRKRRAEGKA